MAISKIGSKALVDCSVAAVDIADNSITAAKLAGSIANAKLANSSVTINSTSVSLGGSANINALDWQSVIVADGSTGTTGVAGRGYFINTTSAAHTFTLPVSATRGDTIAIKDYAGTFATFNLTIGRNGHNIQGVANNSLISTNRASVVLVYVDVTRGWEYVTESNVADLQVVQYVAATGGTVTTSGSFKIHTFTGDSTFVVSCAGNPAGSYRVDYLVVAGGAGGGGSNCTGAGGGGAGGYRTTFPSPGCNAGSFPVTATTYPITVGAGGSQGTITPSPSSATNGGAGSNSVFSTITSTGGGGGANYGNSPAAGSGGSGGGSSYAGTRGTGNTPPVSPPQGNPGGVGGTSSPAQGGGGGGGAGSAGFDAPNCSSAGAGGNGSTNSISGTPTTYAGGGGGGFYQGPSSTGGAGGPGGGGRGYGANFGSGCSGAANTGGGGGGGGRYGSPLPASAGWGGNGGKGIIIIRYKFQ